MRKRRLSMVVLFGLCIVPVLSKAQPAMVAGSRSEITCDVTGSKVQGSTVDLRASGVPKGIATRWLYYKDVDEKLPLYVYPRPATNTAKLYLGGFEPNQTVSIGLFSFQPHDTSGSDSKLLCAARFVVAIRLISRSTAVRDPYKSSKEIGNKNAELLYDLERISTAKEKVASESLQGTDVALGRIKQEDKNDYLDLQNDIETAKKEIAALQSEHHQVFGGLETRPLLEPGDDQLARLALDDDSQIAKVRQIENRVEHFVNYKPRENAYAATVGKLPNQEFPVGSWQIKVFYATDRKSIDQNTGQFSNDRDPDKVHYGTALVSIPSTHKAGEIEEPLWWHFEFSKDPSKHVVIYNCCSALNKAQFVRSVKSYMALHSSQVLIFVHGYNNTFSDVILRTAQIAQDLHFNGVPMAYDWASAGGPNSSSMLRLLPVHLRSMLSPTVWEIRHYWQHLINSRNNNQCLQ
jgi:Alpha/beta hydrolase of unknown function (DUF900)